MLGRRGQPKGDTYLAFRTRRHDVRRPYQDMVVGVARTRYGAHTRKCYASGWRRRTSTPLRGRRKTTATVNYCYRYSVRQHRRVHVYSNRSPIDHDGDGPFPLYFLNEHERRAAAVVAHSSERSTTSSHFPRRSAAVNHIVSHDGGSGSGCGGRTRGKQFKHERRTDAGAKRRRTKT